ncbi:UNVERIFIED_CONTAM: hypothetical protein Sradi_3656000 [Sesamum radiatum]|uniref:Uncharacterized protein n=1 Tax=Sesamum radiatum TaxID=300843 RepID=A0AAW2QJ24_SESRA
MRNSKKRAAAASSEAMGGKNVEADEVDIGCRVKRPKNERSCTVAAQEVDVQGKKRRKRAEFASRLKIQQTQLLGIHQA